MMCNNISFKGFDNVFCAYDIPIDSKRVTYIAARLNDEETPDLTKFRKLIEMQGYLCGPDSDILTLTYVADREKMTENLYFGIKDMYFGDELLAIEKAIPKYMTQEKFDEEKNLHVKAYTFLASITKRINAQEKNIENQGKIKVIDTLQNTLLSLRKNNKYIFSQSQIYTLLNNGILKRVPSQNIGKMFNNAIVETMKKFLL